MLWWSTKTVRQDHDACYGNWSRRCMGHTHGRGIQFFNMPHLFYTSTYLHLLKEPKQIKNKTQTYIPYYRFELSIGQVVNTTFKNQAVLQFVVLGNFNHGIKHGKLEDPPLLMFPALQPPLTSGTSQLAIFDYQKVFHIDSKFVATINMSYRAFHWKYPQSCRLDSMWDSTPR